MYRTGPVYVWMVFYLGFYGFEDFCQFLLGLYQVNDGKKAVTVQNLFGVWAYLVGEVGEDADDFLSLFSFQFAYTVVCLYHLGRFYEDSFTCGTLIVYDTFDFALQSRDDGNNQSAVTQGWGYVFSTMPSLCAERNILYKVREMLPSVFASSLRI